MLAGRRRACWAALQLAARLRITPVLLTCKVVAHVGCLCWWSCVGGEAQSGIYLLAPATRQNACETIGCAGDHRVRIHTLAGVGDPNGSRESNNGLLPWAIGRRSHGLWLDGVPDVNGWQHAACCTSCNAASTSSAHNPCYQSMPSKHCADRPRAPPLGGAHQPLAQCICTQTLCNQRGTV